MAERHALPAGEGARRRAVRPREPAEEIVERPVLFDDEDDMPNRISVVLVKLPGLCGPVGAPLRAEGQEGQKCKRRRSEEQTSYRPAADWSHALTPLPS